VSRVDFEVEVFGVWEDGGYGGEVTEGEEGGVREGDAAATAAVTGAGRPCGRDKGARTKKMGWDRGVVL
jgi:hypothetical protein